MIPMAVRNFWPISFFVGSLLENPSGFLGHLGDLLAFLNGQCGVAFRNKRPCLPASHGLRFACANGPSYQWLRSQCPCAQNLSVVLVTFGFALGKRLVDAIDPLACPSRIRRPDPTACGRCWDSRPRPPTPMAAKRRRSLGASFAAFAR